MLSSKGASLTDRPSETQNAAESLHAPENPGHLLAVIRALIVLTALAGIGWLILWAFRLTRAVFLPGNLQLELHWLEVGLLHSASTCGQG